MLKKYIYLPKDLWLLVFFNSLPVYFIFFFTFAILALCDVKAFMMKDISGFYTFLIWLWTAPMASVYTACMAWLVLKPGNMLLRLLAIAKGDL